MTETAVLTSLSIVISGVKERLFSPVWAFWVTPCLVTSWASTVRRSSPSGWGWASPMRRSRPAARPWSGRILSATRSLANCLPSPAHTMTRGSGQTSSMWTSLVRWRSAVSRSLRNIVTDPDISDLMINKSSSSWVTTSEPQPRSRLSRRRPGCPPRPPSRRRRLSRRGGGDSASPTTARSSGRKCPAYRAAGCQQVSPGSQHQTSDMAGVVVLMLNLIPKTRPEASHVNTFDVLVLVKQWLKLSLLIQVFCQELNS